ncbi:hypothetical protein AQUCO_01400889v1 [Aquilegia coerulea]|uniref:J domain-containing protein n=1 Tax=Aquilegia coerulea TaxID=218851 RepID=A0A2G5DYM2_AQUCA|nr:hypothetical protein AQUCO_01400889v1 [Aquilegia coerulea]
MAPQLRLRRISYSKDLVDGQPVYVSSNCFPVKATKLEPAGHMFHSVALKLSGYFKEEVVKTDDQNVPSDKGQSYMASSDSYSSKGKKKSGGEGQQQDHYALLGLGHLRFLATEDQIRKSYRETALKHHPDKQAALLLSEEGEAAKQAKKEEIENNFKSIQEAYEVLIDPVKRRIYDSTDEFDDEIPTDCAPQDFFKVFGPAFMRNGRWSVSQPIPSLGEENSPLEDVDSFYNFWYSFKSWREFPHADDFDLEQAESRDHKRWMERQNAKLREKARKEEYARVRSLVDNAYKRDPRILRRKEEEKAEKKRRKESKYLAKRLQEEEAARAAEEERRRKEEEDRLAAEAAAKMKKVKEKEKKLLRKERTRLRTLSAPVVVKRLLELKEDDVESLCMSLDIDRMRSLCDEIEHKAGTERAELLKQALGGNISANGVKKEENNIPSQNGSIDANGSGAGLHSKSENPFSNYEKKDKPWNKEEIELLRKGMLKYPKGTSRRWEVISEFIGTGRSVEEILKATKTVLLQKPDSAKAFDSFLEKRKPAPTIASPLTTRQETEGTMPPVDQPEANSPEKVDTKQPSSSAGTDQNPENTTANGVSDPDVWSAVQERALIQALKTFPKEASQRWERVAASVPGKTVNQCKKKFALLKESFRNKKTVD